MTASLGRAALNFIDLDFWSRLKDWWRVGLDCSRPILSRHFAQALHFGPLAGLKGLVEFPFPKVLIRRRLGEKPCLLPLLFGAPPKSALQHRSTDVLPRSQF